MPTIDRNKRPLQDFIRVLEVLLHKGPLPLNTIGPTVDLTPGSISIGVDRLVARGLVRRIESAEDRRVRIVALTPTRQGPNCFSLPKAFRAEEEGVLWTEPRGTSCLRGG